MPGQLSARPPCQKAAGLLYRTIGLQGRPVTSQPGPGGRATGSLVFGLQGLLATGPSDLRAIGPLGHQVTRPQGQGGGHRATQEGSFTLWWD
eukprot:7403401-Alexandrium_andersonii.AAC.1